MFDSNKEDLKDILEDADKGKLQLPDFQRSYVWGDEDVRSLLASIAKGFPVGALLTLETGGEVNFKPRLLEGVKPKDVRPEELLLDGQQRVTSLYQAMYSQKPVRTTTPRGTVVARYYYLDIDKSLMPGADLEEAIIGVLADRIVRSNFGRNIELDLSTSEAEFEHNLFPLRLAFDHEDWVYDWRDYWRDRERDVSDLDRGFFRGIIRSIQSYKMPLIQLDRNNSREAICLVFEKVNVGGKKLDAFELVTAVFAADEYDLREDWSGTTNPPVPGRRKRMTEIPNRRDVLTSVASTDFLQACTLLHTRGRRLAKAKEGVPPNDLPQVSCKRDALLALPLDAYRKYTDDVEAGFIEASEFLNEQKIMWHKDVPYPPLIVALASTFAILEDRRLTAPESKKLAQWFWSVTLGELYGSATDTRMARDVPELVQWIVNGGAPPRSIDEAYFNDERLRTLRSRVSAAYKGIHALMMRRGCRDFITGKPTDIMTFFQDSIDIHHVFPRSWCQKLGIEPGLYNSIVNKTPLSKRSNIEIGGDAPSVYLARIERNHKISPSELDDILRSHLIEPEHLRNDDFQSIFIARSKALSALVSEAMGKSVVHEEEGNEREEEAALEEEDELLEEVA